MTDTVDAETKGMLDGLKKLFGPKDTATFDAAMVQAEVNKAVAPLAQSITDLVAMVNKLTPTTDTETAEQKTAREAAAATAAAAAAAAAASTATFDSAYIARVSSAAEILAPGTKIPTFDAADKVAAEKAITDTKRAALKATNEVGKMGIKAFVPTVEVDAMTTDQLDMAFFGASSMVGATNNQVMAAMAMAAGPANVYKTSKQASEDAQKRSDERWGKKSA